VQHEPSPTSLRLSVVIVVGSLRHRAQRTLKAILSQDALDQLEVIIVDVGNDSASWGRVEPPVRVHRMSPSTLLSHARAEAVSIARAPLVAFLEEHTAPEPGWAAEIIAADDGEWAVAGTAIRHGNPGSPQSDASYQVSYGLFEPPVSGGEATVLPGHNSVYRRSVLIDLGAALPELFAIDTVLHEMLRRAGRRLVMLEAGVISHWNETTIPAALRGHWWFHRSYGVRRANFLGWSAIRRLSYVVLAPLIPVYALLLWGRRRHEVGRQVLWSLLRLGPRMLLIHTASAVAQAVGLMIGEGPSLARFTDFELSEAARVDTSPAQELH